MKIAQLQNTQDGEISIVPFLHNQIEKYRADLPSHGKRVIVYFDNEKQLRQLAFTNQNKCLEFLKELWFDFEPKTEMAPNTICPKIAVSCKTVEDVEAFISVLSSAQIKTDYTTQYYFDKHGQNTCFSLSNGFAFAPKAHYESIGFEIINHSEVTA